MKRKPNPRRRPRTKPVVKTMCAEDLKAIVARARAAGLSEEDCATLEALIETLEMVTGELDKKTVTLARLRQLFGLATSEKTRAVLAKAIASVAGGGQNEDQEPSPPSGGTKGDEGETAGRDDGVDKRKGHGRNGAAEYTGAKTVDVPHDSLKPGGPCPDCKRGKLYEQKEPKVVIRVKGQAPLTATVWRLQRLRCALCGKIFTASAPADVGDEKYDSSTAAMIGLLKYGSGLPFNRLERLEGSLGVPLPAATQWDIVHRGAHDLAPVQEELVRQAAQGEVIHHDDTNMKILELIEQNRRLLEEDPKARTGMHTTGVVSILEDRKIAVFFTGRQHGGENVSDLLEKRAADLASPIKMADGAQVNEPDGLDAILANCLVHGRRKFVEVVESFPDACRHVLEVLREVYLNDAETKRLDLSADERLRFHQEKSRPPMDDLEAWMKAQIESKIVEPNSGLGEAIGYMLSRWEKLTLFLREPGAPLDNNTAERALKKVILHRKNALFYKTENGAWVGDVYMSLIYTAELAKVNPFDYLVELLRHPEAVKKSPSEWLPWNYLEAKARLEISE